MTIDMVLKEKEIISASDFINLTDEERSEIVYSRPVPVDWGSDCFGKIEVTFKTAKYVPRSVF